MLSWRVDRPLKWSWTGQSVSTKTISSLAPARGGRRTIPEAALSRSLLAAAFRCLDEACRSTNSYGPPCLTLPARQARREYHCSGKNSLELLRGFYAVI